MQKIALINQKGGTGKTTSAVNIGAGLSRLGKTILLIDIDPQASLSYSLGIKTYQSERTVYELLRKEATLDQVIVERTSRLKIIPGSLDLANIEIEFAGKEGNMFMLKDILQGLRGFEYIIVDCPPALNILTVNALTYVQKAYIPLQTEFLALQGMGKLLDTIEAIKKEYNPSLQIRLLGTRYDQRKVLNRQIMEKIKGFLGNRVFDTLIRENISLAEAPSFGLDVFEYKVKSHGSEDYLALCKEIIKDGE